MLLFYRLEMMTSGSLWCSLVLLGVFPVVTKGWMDVEQSRSLYSDAGRLHQEVLYTCCSYSSWLSVLGLCSGSPHCKQKTTVGLSMYICIKHLPRRSVKNSERETLKLIGYIGIIWKWNCASGCCGDTVFAPKTLQCAVSWGLLTPVKLNITSKLSCLFTWVSGHLGET